MVNMFTNVIFTFYIGTKLGSSNATGFQANVRTIGHLNYENSSRVGEQKVARIDKTPEMEKYKKIAQNADKLDKNTNVQKMKGIRLG